MDDPASNFLTFFLASDITNPETASAATIVLKLFGVLLLVGINGFFVAAEFAIVGVRRSKIEALADDGNASAIRLLGILGNLNAYLSASQLGITLASLGLGWLGEPVISALLENWLVVLPESTRHFVSIFIAFTVITTFHIVLGEQAPKLLGLELAERVALAVSLPMRIFYMVFKLPIHALDWASAKIVRPLGLKSESEHASAYTEDEIRHIIEASRKRGHLNPEEQRLINQVFEFSETTVKEAMVPRTAIAAIPQTLSLEEIVKAFRQHGYSRMPVYRESMDDIAGFIHGKDVMSHMLRPKSFRLEKILQKPVYVVDNARLEDVLRQMQKEKFHFGFVVDEHGGVEGIITLEDLLEEIVGEISDEHDEEVNEQIKEEPEGSGTYVLDGGLAVRDLNRRLGLNIPVSEAYTTVAGFLMSESGQILGEGEQVPFNGHVFKIEKVTKRRIMRVRMEKS